MKIISFYLIFFLSIQHGVSQTALLHTANAKNTAGHITTIDNPASNNKSNVILIINQRNDKVSNSNEIGVWYNQGKWKIFNQNLKPIPANSQFNVLILDPKQVTSSFVHTVTKSNTSAHVTNLSHKLTNGKKNASILVTQNYGKYNTSPVGVWYNINKWM